MYPSKILCQIKKRLIFCLIKNVLRLDILRHRSGESVLVGAGHRWSLTDVGYFACPALPLAFRMFLRPTSLIFHHSLAKWAAFCMENRHSSLSPASKLANLQILIHFIHLNRSPTVQKKEGGCKISRNPSQMGRLKKWAQLHQTAS